MRSPPGQPLPHTVEHPAHGFSMHKPAVGGASMGCVLGLLAGPMVFVASSMLLRSWFESAAASQTFGLVLGAAAVVGCGLFARAFTTTRGFYDSSELVLPSWPLRQGESARLVFRRHLRSKQAVKELTAIVRCSRTGHPDLEDGEPWANGDTVTTLWESTLTAAPPDDSSQPQEPLSAASYRAPAAPSPPSLAPDQTVFEAAFLVSFPPTMPASTEPDILWTVEVMVGKGHTTHKEEIALGVRSVFKLSVLPRN